MTKVDLDEDKRGGDSRKPRAAQPTLKTIAGIAGLAVPTVSRALSGAEDISIATRARVRQIADEIGYIPNRAGVRLRTGRTNVISLVLSTEHEVMNHTARLISSVAGGLRDTPFHLNITPYFGDEDPMKPIRYIVETRSADAVIFNQTRPEDPRVEYLRQANFPFATHGRTIWAEEHPYYDYDNAAFATVAVQALARKGRRKILLVAPPRIQKYGQDMVTGARKAAQLAGVALDVLDTATSDSGIVETETALADRLAQDHSVDGLICASNSSAIGCLSAVEMAGFVLGETMDLFTKEAIPLLGRIRPAIMTVHEDVTRTGEFLARAAMQSVLSPEKPPMQFLEVPELSAVRSE